MQVCEFETGFFPKRPLGALLGHAFFLDVWDVCARDRVWLGRRVGCNGRGVLVAVHTCGFGGGSCPTHVAELE